MLENAEHWEDVGYEIDKGPLEAGQEVSILRPERNSIPLLSNAQSSEQLIETAVYNSIDEGVAGAAMAILDQIKDGGVMFFRRDPLDKTLLSYGYLEFPYVGVSYKEFVAEMGGDVDEVDLSEEYEDYRSQLPLRPHITPVRYDWSPALYRQGAHPASHLHLGHETELRLAIDALLTPVQFILFVIRHFYVNVWEGQACEIPEVLNAAASISDAHIVEEYRKGRDFLELRLVSIVDAEARSALIQAKSR